MDEARALSLLGLAMRAGQVVSGDDMTEKVVRAGRAGLVLMDQGASANTKDKYESMCRFRGVSLMETGEESLGRAIGKPGRMVAAVLKGPFSEKVAALLTGSQRDHN